jgi:SulP family sulfate permease
VLEISHCRCLCDCNSSRQPPFIRNYNFLFVLLRNVFGVKMDTINTVGEAGSQFANKFVNVNAWAILVFICCTLLLLLPKLWKRAEKFPVVMAAMVGSTFAVYLSRGDLSVGLPVVGEIPAGLPTPRAVPITWQFLSANMVSASAIAVIGYIEAISVAKKFAALRNYFISTNQELLGLSLCNMIGAAFGAFPVTGSLTRTAVKYECGARTPAASLIGSIVVVLVLLFATQALHFTPQACLASVTIVAAWSLIDVATLRFLWRHDRLDFAQSCLTLAVTLAFGVETGIEIGIASTLLQVIYRSSKPRFVRLGQLANRSGEFRDVLRFRGTQTFPGVLIVRFDARLAFYNVNGFVQRLEEFERAEPTPPHSIIVDCEGVNDVDSTALLSLSTLMTRYRNKHVSLLWARVKQGMRDAVQRAGMVEELGGFCFSVQEALEVATTSRDESVAVDLQQTTTAEVEAEEISHAAEAVENESSTRLVLPEQESAIEMGVELSAPSSAGAERVADGLKLFATPAGGGKYASIASKD